VSHTAPARRLIALVALLFLALLAGPLGPGSPQAGAVGVSPTVDAPAPYEGQSTCTKAPRPGTVALATWLMKTYPVTGSMGMMRACGSGGRSEHKDGRAFDWKADVKRKATRRAAYGFITRALATDGAGNAHALARRMGIMYIIYNDTIWSSYFDFRPRPYLHAGCKKRKKCSRTLRHRDHVHISLGYAGAAAQTSWYRDRGVASEPVLHPGTDELDADETAVTAFTVAANGTPTTSPFQLRAGVTYRVVATHTVRYDAAGSPGDAHCTATAGTTTWAPTPRGSLVTPDPTGLLGWSTRAAEGSRHPASPAAAPTAETHGLLVNGALRWEGGCRSDHTYEAWFTPTTRQRLRLQYADAAPGDNAGTFTVYVARDDILRSSLVG
jgi:hypothetical protein